MCFEHVIISVYSALKSWFPLPYLWNHPFSPKRTEKIECLDIHIHQIYFLFVFHLRVLVWSQNYADQWELGFLLLLECWYAPLKELHKGGGGIPLKKHPSHNTSQRPNISDMPPRKILSENLCVFSILIYESSTQSTPCFLLANRIIVVIAIQFF